MMGGRLSVFMALIICLTPSMADYLTNSRLAVRGIALHPSLVFRGGADADSTLVEPSIVDKSDGTLPTTVLPDNGAMKSTQPSCWSALHKLWRVVVSLLSPSYSYAKVGTDILGDSSQTCGFAQDDESWRTQRKKLNDAELQPNSRKRVLKDLRIMKRDGSEIGIEVEDCECLTDWVVKVIGAAGTIYEGEIYRLRVRFHPDYPSQPPEVTFMRPAPVHEHIYSDGKICLNILYNDWNPKMDVKSLCLSLLSMLSSAKKKSRPPDNDSTVVMSQGQKTRNMQWEFHDDKC